MQLGDLSSLPEVHGLLDSVHLVPIPISCFTFPRPQGSRCCAGRTEVPLGILTGLDAGCVLIQNKVGMEKREFWEQSGGQDLLPG